MPPAAAATAGKKRERDVDTSGSGALLLDDDLSNPAGSPEGGAGAASTTNFRNVSACNRCRNRKVCLRCVGKERKMDF